MSTVAGLIPDEVHVINARRELKAAGFAENKVSLLRAAADVWNRVGGHKQAQVVKRFGVQFWSAAPSRYPDEVHSLATAPGERRQRSRISEE